ncbi:MAG TPA: Gfo/Idh/MocA family oxidoreductase, partial [Actinomycetota bacterium]|nr:Gfo/Idh/MocA family oxidoreductase [Actinomycetota bacterium]
IEATLFPRVHTETATRHREAGFKADRQRYLLATHGAHVFDTVRFLLGDVASLVARHRQDDRDHVWQALVTTTAGAVGTVTIAADVPGVPAEGIEVLGASGAVRVDLHFPFSRRAATVRAYRDGAVVVPALTDGDVYERQVEAFARAIREGGHPDPDVRDGLAAMRLIEATATAVETGSEVRL